MIKAALRKTLPTITFIVALYPLVYYFSDPQTYPTHSTQWPKDLNPGFFLVLDTKTASLPDDIHYKTYANKTYIGPFDNIKECHRARVITSATHPGIHAQLMKLDDTNAFK